MRGRGTCKRTKIPVVFRSHSFCQMGATDEEKAEAAADVDDEFAGRQQEMETAIIQVGWTVLGVPVV